MKNYVFLGLIFWAVGCYAAEYPEVGWATIKNNYPTREPMPNLDAVDWTTSDSDTLLIGLFDGYKSSGPSEVLEKDMLKDLTRGEQLKKDPTECLRRCFDNFNRTCKAKHPECGASAMVGAYDPKKGLILANAGLCRAFTIEQAADFFRISPLQEPHTMSNEQELQRIRKIIETWPSERLHGLIEYYPDLRERKAEAHRLFPVDEEKRLKHLTDLNDLSNDISKHLQESGATELSVDFVMGYLKSSGLIRGSTLTRSVGDYDFKTQNDLAELVASVPQITSHEIYNNSLLVLISSGLYQAIVKQLAQGDKSSKVVYGYLRDEIRTAIHILNNSETEFNLSDVAQKVLGDIQNLYKARQLAHSDMTLVLAALPKVTIFREDHLQKVHSGTDPATASTADEERLY